MYSFAFCHFIEKKKKEKKEQKNKRNRKNKHTKELHRPGNLSITSLAFYHCTDAYVKELLPKESS